MSRARAGATSSSCRSGTFAAEVARVFVAELITDLPAEPVVVNLNVPNLELADIAGWELTEVGLEPPRAISEATLIPTADPDVFGVAMEWGQKQELPAHTDGGAIELDLVTVSYLSRLQAEPRAELLKPEAALDAARRPRALTSTTVGVGLTSRSGR